MKPYYEHAGITIYHGDSRDLMQDHDGCVLTDPPYNIGYHYAAGGDSRQDGEYDELLRATVRPDSIVVAYPEVAFRVARIFCQLPTRCGAWVYPANTPRQWRILAWFGIEPDFDSVLQPYKNPSDRRIKARIADGQRARGYDWREIPQVKNVSGDKTEHPCQNPVEVMEWAALATNQRYFIDPFMGSGSTLVACKRIGRQAIGIEIEERYCEIAAKRLSQEVLPLAAGDSRTEGM